MTRHNFQLLHTEGDWQVIGNHLKMLPALQTDTYTFEVLVKFQLDLSADDDLAVYLRHCGHAHRACLQVSDVVPVERVAPTCSFNRKVKEGGKFLFLGRYTAPALTPHTASIGPSGTKVPEDMDPDDEMWLDAPLTDEERTRAENAIANNPYVYDMNTGEQLPNPYYQGDEPCL